MVVLPRGQEPERRGSRDGGVEGVGARQVHERAWMCLGETWGIKKKTGFYDGSAPRL